jgi:hypothetical protein
MTLLIRFILVSLIIYLLFRSFVRFFAEEEDSSHKRNEKHYNDQSSKSKGVSKEVGEYVDYEEVDD